MSGRPKYCHNDECGIEFEGDTFRYWCSDVCETASRYLNGETGKQTCDCCSACLAPERLTYYEQRKDHYGDPAGRWLCYICANTHISSSVEYPSNWSGEGHNKEIAQAVGFIGSTILERLEQLGAIADDSAICDADGLVNVLLNFHSMLEAGEVSIAQIRETDRLLRRAIPQKVSDIADSARESE